MSSSGRKEMKSSQMKQYRTANVSTRLFKENSAKPGPHPSYLPALAPAVFYLSGSVKGCLIRRSSEGVKQFSLFSQALEVILQGVPLGHKHFSIGRLTFHSLMMFI
jgi:hypothetical protein